MKLIRKSAGICWAAVVQLGRRAIKSREGCAPDPSLRLKNGCVRDDASRKCAAPISIRSIGPWVHLSSGQDPSAKSGRLGMRRAKCIAIFWATLQEIFEESAYARFLERQQTTRSRQSYGAFLREQEHSKARRPRCC